jgi:hypothetical protein
MLGSFAQFERSLIRERTIAGLEVAASQGRVGGNPGVKNRDPVVLAKIRASSHANRLKKVIATMDAWMPTVQRLRPGKPWVDVTKAVNAGLPSGAKTFRRERLISCVRRLAAEGLADPALLAPAPRTKPRKGRLQRQRVLDTIAGLIRSRPTATLRQIGLELTELGHHPPRCGTAWATSTIQTLINKTQADGKTLQRPPLRKLRRRRDLGIGKTGDDS